MDNATISNFGANNMPRFDQSEVKSVDREDESTLNQTMTVTYKNPIYIKDNGTDVPFVAFSAWANSSDKRDYDAIIFTLTDAENPDKHVSIMFGFWYVDGGVTYSTMYAKGTGQKWKGYHALNSGDKYFNADLGVRQGTMIEQPFLNSMGVTVWLYYDAASRSFYCDKYWSSYNSRNMTFSYDGSDKVICIRDLTDVTSENNDGVAFDEDIDSAYLSITTVRGINNYTDEFGDKINTHVYQNAFRGGSGSGHTLSDNGAIFGLREINEVSLNFNNLNAIKSTGKTVYVASDFESESKVTVPALDSYNAIMGKKAATEYTADLYVRAKDASGNIFTMQGLNSDKWASGCYFKAPTTGEYTIEYSTVSDFTSTVASSKCTVKAFAPDMDNLIKPANASEYFEGNNYSATFGEFSTGNSDKQNGLILSVFNENKALYKKDIDITDITKEDVLVEFMPLQNTYEYRQVHFRFSDKSNPDNYFTVDFEYNGDSTYRNLTMVYAAGNNQEKYGLKYIRSNNEYDNGTIAQNLIGVTQSGDAYTTIGIYYDREENCVYVSPTYDFTRGTIGKAKLRDFDSDEIRTGRDGATAHPEEPFWNGFTGNTVTMEVWVTGVGEDAYCNIGILNVAGERLSQKLSATPVTKAVVGYEYKIPVPKYFNNDKNAYEDFASSKYTLIKAENESGDEVTVTDGSFTPDAAGEYTVIYAVREGENSYCYELPVTVMSVSEAEPIVFDTAQSNVSDGMSVYLGNTLIGNVTASSDIILLNDKTLDVVTTLYKDSTPIKTFNAGETVEIDCNELGNYKLVYKTSDYVGRTAEKEVAFTVTRTCVMFKDAQAENTEFDITDGIIDVSENDIVVEDIYTDGETETKTPSTEFASFNVAVKIKFNDGEYENYTAQYNLSRVGVFTIKYEITYTLTAGGDTLTAEKIRTVNAFDNGMPEFDKNVEITGAKVNEDKTVGAVWIKALTGAEIGVAAPKAYDTVGGVKGELSGVTASFTNANGEVRDITDLFVSGIYTFMASEKGTYYVVFKVSDGTWETTLNYVFEVKDLWLTVDISEDTEAVDVGIEYVLPKPTIKDYNGNTVDGGTITVTAYYTDTQYEKVADYKWTPASKGDVKIIYTVEKDGEIATTERIVNVLDRIVPVITFDREPAMTGNVGETYVLPNVTITDNADSGLAYKVYLKFGEEITELDDISFIPEKEGTYTLIIECTDTSGNKATKEVMVQVSEAPAVGNETPKKGCKGCGSQLSAASVGIIAALLIAGVGVLMIFNRKKKEY